jgi:hypothetical protein
LLENKYEQRTLIDDVVRLLDLKETLSGLWELQIVNYKHWLRES